MTDWKQESKKLAVLVAVFAAIFWLPLGWDRFDGAVMEALALAKWYAQEHVLLCLVPAFFIAGAIGVFVSQASVMKYLGPRANKPLAYGVASVSGTILAVCSCTILPLFSGIYRMGAGLGPAVAFLYSGPAISVLAIILTARILGAELGIARAVGAIAFALVIGLVMHFMYRKEEGTKAAAAMVLPQTQATRPLWQTAAYFGAMVAILVFANWGSPREFTFKTADGGQFVAAVIKEPPPHAASAASFSLEITEGPDCGKCMDVPAGSIQEKTPLPGISTSIFQAKWFITAIAAAALAVMLVLWFKVAWWKVVLAAVPAILLALLLPMDGMMVMIPFAAAAIGLSVITSSDKGEVGEWFGSTWGFAKQITPLLFAGVLVAGFLLGRPDREGMIPSQWVQMLVGATPDTFLAASGLSGGSTEGVIRALWSLWTNFFASIFGAFMYFATLTEVPILQGLIGSGMGKGPALALLLSGPSLSLPSMLVIRGVIGTRKTLVYVCLVIVMSTIAGMIFGALWG